MNHKPTQSQVPIDNEIYMKLWAGEQAYQRYRWSVVTFFIGISFAIIGLSFQTRIDAGPLLVMRIFGLSVYWFAYGLYSYFHGFSKVLRDYLLKLEEEEETVSLTLHGKLAELRDHSILHKVITAKRALLLFGILYTLLIILVRLLGY